jgi:hypothetical protein
LSDGSVKSESCNVHLLLWLYKSIRLRCASEETIDFRFVFRGLVGVELVSK